MPGDQFEGKLRRFRYDYGARANPDQRTRQSTAFPRLRILLSVFSLIAFAWPSLATTYYVSPAGSDGNVGTSSAPLLTIQRAANMVNPGDKVIVRDGTYSNAAAAGVGSKLVSVSRGGTANSWVTFMAENIWEP